MIITIMVISQNHNNLVVFSELEGIGNTHDLDLYNSLLVYMRNAQAGTKK